MKKEVLFAIILGFAIGLVITYGIYKAQSNYQTNQDQPPQNPTPIPSQIPTPSPQQITISSPTETSVLTTSPIVISGFSLPFSYITAVSSDYHTLTQADSSGNFTFDFELSSPATVVTITSLSPDQESKSSTEITLIYQPNTSEESISTETEE